MPVKRILVDLNEILESLDYNIKLNQKFLSNPKFPEKHREMLKENILWAQKTEEYLMDSPSVDAEIVRHGRWIQTEEFDPNVKANYIRVKCSECNAEVADDWEGKLSIRIALNYKYCPNCGAKMDGKEE